MTRESPSATLVSPDELLLDPVIESDKLPIEADPALDVEGVDAAHKLTLLAANAFGVPLQFDKVYTEGITQLESADIAFAERLGYCVKLVGIAKRGARGLELRVHPTLLPLDHPLGRFDVLGEAPVDQLADHKRFE